MPTHITKVKCMKCQLHFQAHSWHPDWKPMHCPECGSTEGFLVWRSESVQQIYEHVPGNAEHVGIV